MKITRTIITVFMLGFIFLSSCTSNYSNKESYNLTIGDEFEIYYTGNSCCGRCWNVATLETVEFLGERTIKETDIPGGTDQYAIRFKAVKVGVDSLKTHYYTMSDSCNLNAGEATIYVINVSK